MTHDEDFLDHPINWTTSGDFFALFFRVSRKRQKHPAREAEIIHFLLEAIRLRIALIRILTENARIQLSGIGSIIAKAISSTIKKSFGPFTRILFIAALRPFFTTALIVFFKGLLKHLVSPERRLEEVVEFRSFLGFFLGFLAELLDQLSNWTLSGQSLKAFSSFFRRPRKIPALEDRRFRLRLEAMLFRVALIRKSRRYLRMRLRTWFKGVGIKLFKAISSRMSNHCLGSFFRILFRVVFQMVFKLFRRRFLRFLMGTLLGYSGHRTRPEATHFGWRHYWSTRESHLSCIDGDHFANQKIVWKGILG